VNLNSFSAFTALHPNGVISDYCDAAFSLIILGRLIIIIK